MTRTIAILGAGELGATLARRIAERELARHIVLVDVDLGRARGKALDLAQSGPVDGYDVRLEGRAALDPDVSPDVLVVADPPELVDLHLGMLRVREYVRPLVPHIGRGVLLAAGSHAPSLAEAAVGLGLARDRVLGSLPLALAAALRRRLATELRAEPSEVAATILGLPPDGVFVPQGTALLGGIPVDRVAPMATRRALESLRGHTLGPVALATAATAVIAALEAPRTSVLPVFVRLDGEYGHRGVALAVPARIGTGRMGGVVECPLDPVDRVAMDTAAQRRFEAGGA